MHVFYIAPTSYGVGLTSIALGLVHALDKLGLRVGFLKPVAQQHRSDTGPERSTQQVRAATSLTPPDPVPLSKVENLLGANKRDELLERVVNQLSQAAKDADVVVVEGLVPSRTMPYAGRLNVDIARSLNADIIIVHAPEDETPDDTADKLQITADTFGGTGNPNVIGYILNKVHPDYLASLIDRNGECQTLRPFRRKAFKPIGHIPWNNTLSAPRTRDIATLLQAEILNEGEIDNRRVAHRVLCARTAANIVQHLRPDALIIAPGDRDDIIMATCLAALNGVPLAGLLLTNDLPPQEQIATLCRRAIQETGLPILITDSNSYTTATRLDRMNTEVPLDDQERLQKVMDDVAEHLDIRWLQDRCGEPVEPRLSPPAFRHQLVENARKANKRIVLPEGDEPRTIQAAILCQQRGIARCVLLARTESVEQVASELGITLPADLEILDPDTLRPQYVDPMVELRRSKGLTEPMAEAQLEDNVVLGTMMLAQDDVDGLVSGAVHTTANTIRPAFQLIKARPGTSTVSSIFFMLLPDQVLIYGDCAVNPDPDASALADIAIQSADSAARFGIPPRVAMISYSTGSSGHGTDVEKVREATRLAREKRPDLLIDGPLQYDAAAIASVAGSKAPDSPVAGKATVFVFPDLNTGNTTYKAVQRSANVISVGPMLQGLRKPVNDLSRGALVDDIVYTIALTAIQATSN
ncbi:phosphate acetyltransferase [Kistimonas scapharcae]|uniref:Phosphate acetyltransferase n=1 Tax=Kistimonas scapharcae TaxID=1036133 RepID=A0ABP8UVD9_9GAMM